MHTPAAPTAAVPGAGQIDDVGALYTRLSRRLEQIVRGDVRAADPVVEDACQFAWSRLVFHAHRVHRDAALSWLATTAVREARRLLRRADQDLSLDATIEWIGDCIPARRVPAPEELVIQRAALESIGELPERQQRMLWLRGLGLSYREIASHSGCTTRTVERQLLRARMKLRIAGPVLAAE
jgi:RNA polymerase sigma factor (sigma-70 family)